MLVRKNVGSIDRGIRAALGIILLIVAFTVFGLASGAPLGILTAVVGVLMLASAAIRVCLLYSLLGFSTCKLAAR